MRCTSSKKVRLLAVLLLGICLFGGCGKLPVDIPYQSDSQISSYNVISREKPGVAEGFASNLCIVTENVMDDQRVDMSQAEAAVLFDVNGKQVLYAKNGHERLYPASLTKVMTALVALKYGSVDQTLTATDAVIITESGAQLCGIKSGDTMTLNQALHILLLYSANDVANMIAENIAGSVDGFVELMNQEAQSLGATNTHFANAHGLTDETHYTTAYDLYLIFNAAMQYELFQEIIHMTGYETTYYDSTGAPIEKSFSTTNLFLRGDYKAPENVTVIGGKTGTTKAAGSCLILLARDTSGNPYIAVILRSASRDILYPEMADLLDEINK